MTKPRTVHIDNSLDTNTVFLPGREEWDNLLECLEKHRYTFARTLNAAGPWGTGLITGIFNTLHVGHLRCIKALRMDMNKNIHELAPLVVGINSDASAKMVRGPHFPLIPQHERAEMLAGLEWVDYVVMFDDITPAVLIDRLKPRVFAKGHDYEIEDMPEYNNVMMAGGEVICTGDDKEHSSSGILRFLRGED